MNKLEHRINCLKCYFSILSCFQICNLRHSFGLDIRAAPFNSGPGDSWTNVCTCRPFRQGVHQSYLLSCCPHTVSNLDIYSKYMNCGYNNSVCKFNCSHLVVFSLSISRVSSVKTQLIYCQLKWRHVSTQGVIIRPIVEPCLRYYKWKCTFFGIPKCLQQRENVDTIEVDIYSIIYNKMYPCVP